MKCLGILSLTYPFSPSLVLPGSLGSCRSCDLKYWITLSMRDPRDVTELPFLHSNPLSTFPSRVPESLPTDLL
ncbi:uncharacterized protein BCR38DRAFT_445808, partial [Pseudomassariella vexata]